MEGRQKWLVDARLRGRIIARHFELASEERKGNRQSLRRKSCQSKALFAVNQRPMHGASYDLGCPCADISTLAAEQVGRESIFASLVISPAHWPHHVQLLGSNMRDSKDAHRGRKGSRGDIDVSYGAGQPDH